MVDARQRANSWAWIGLLMSAVGGVTYFLLMSVPWIRSTALPNTILAVAGLAFSVIALARKRTWVTICAGTLSILLSIGFLGSVHILMRLPADEGTVAVGHDAPDFNIPNQYGQTIQLSSYEGKGPVLLVFYRGHW
jgi:AhpC/TSA family